MINIDPDRAMDFLSFVQARHEAYVNRQAGLNPPWTDDPIVASYKFTNVFRILDWGSQFLMKELVDPELTSREQLMRCFLYRHTGMWEAWEFFEAMEGYMPSLEPLLDGTLLKVWKEFRNANDGRFFTKAYLVYPQSNTPGTDKLESIVDLTARLFDPDSKWDIVPHFLELHTPEKQFRWLCAQKGVGSFMASQVLTDWGYTPQCGRDIEEEFDACGPGAINGARALSPKGKVGDTLRWARDAIRNLPNLDLNGRIPSLRDAQNTLCEASKMFRYAEKPLTTKRYLPSHPGPLPDPVLPEHWS